MAAGGPAVQSRTAESLESTALHGLLFDDPRGYLNIKFMIRCYNNLSESSNRQRKDGLES